MDYKIDKLDTQTKVGYHYMEGRESVSLGIWIRAGSRYEKEGIAGISHFLEHLVFRGTQNYTATEIRKSIEGVGGVVNAFTAQEFTCYVVKMRPKFLESAFRVLSDIILHPNLNSYDIEKERKIIVEEIKMYFDIPMKRVREVLDSLLWKNHELGRMVIGNIETVNAISKEEIRNYIQYYYNVDNLTVVACGAVKESKLIHLINKYFPDTPSGKKYQFTPFKEIQSVPRVNFINQDTNQTHLAMGSKALSRDDSRRVVLSILNIILGANMSSRLFNEIREERGLAYQIGSRVIRHTGTGAFVIHAGIKEDNLKKVMEIILDKLREIIENPPSKDELNRAKEYYKGHLMLTLEKTMDNMLWFGEHLVTDSNICHPEYLIHQTDEIEAEEVSQLAKDIFFSNNFSLSVVGDKIEGREKDVFKMLKSF